MTKSLKVLLIIWILAGLSVLGAWFYITKVTSNVQIEQERQCPVWLSDSPQERCKELPNIYNPQPAGKNITTEQTIMQTYNPQRSE